MKNVTDYVTGCFSETYAEAREKFLAAAKECCARVESRVLEGYRGAQGEELAMDVARVSSQGASSAIVVISGTHGPEGFCGSGAQVSMLRDTELHTRLRELGTELVLIHANNPYGFSNLQRTNEHNVDLNRNNLDFSRPLQPNPRYKDVHDLQIPREWPPSAETRNRIAEYIRQHGELAYRSAVVQGQHTHPDGVFYAGTETSWSLRNLHQVLSSQSERVRIAAWIDIHTGLGPSGYAEKQSSFSENLPLTRKIWGEDVFSLEENNANSPPIRGTIMSIVSRAFPGAQTASIALEFGTLPWNVVSDNLRADHWRHRYGASLQPSLIEEIKKNVKDAFYVDSDLWRGMVLGQCRAAVMQAMYGIRALS
ncbi:Protein of unknown function [Variovorax sp. HW608]|uniref:M14 family metallopeptidase n=1 Tax=Variovorax sp. HW608 TaxID=1034889 RepID=UPI00081FC5BF|nr:M14 family metallopeptidase [Variovorax sp. HW608]SCK10259.1 Protein of unknown function [Variovorax sp. HW608]